MPQQAVSDINMEGDQPGREGRFPRGRGAVNLKAI